MRNNHFHTAVFLAVLVLTSSWFASLLYQRQAAGMLHADVVNSDRFRKMQMSEETLSLLLDAPNGMTPGEILTVCYPFSSGASGLAPSWMSKNAILSWRRRLVHDNQNGYLSVKNGYEAVWDDIVCFPVTGTEITYENSWMFERIYGGIRGHEGTDLMPAENLSGVFSVVSMTDGAVEKIGWLEQGGYRIGIQSESGGYFYYAHLDSYAREFAVGELVYAGERLGMMGDTGYGPEGTRGQFDVHLHIGIYIRTDLSEETSVNPYWVLRYAQLLS